MPKLDDEKLVELIQAKLDAEEGIDSGWVTALVLMKVKPVLETIAHNLERIENAICEDGGIGHSVSHRLAGVENLYRIPFIEELLKKLVKGGKR